MKIALVEMASVDYLNIYAFVSKMHRGIPLLAAILEKEGRKVDCFVEAIDKFQWQDLLRYDIVGFSIISCTANPTYKIIKKLYDNGFLGQIIVGGPHATVLPEESLKAGADIVVRHEGDKTIVEVVQAIEKHEQPKDILGISWKKNGEFFHNPDQVWLSEEELSALPFPALNSIQGHHKICEISLIFSRGCPYNCEFCAVRAMFGPGHRYSSVDSRIRQLETLRDKYPELWQNCTIFFADDNFFGNSCGKAIAIEMLNQMIVEDLIPPKGFLCQMRVTDASPEVAELLKKAGCSTVCLGIESADANILKALRKGQDPEQIRIGLANLHKQGILTLAMTIAGADNDTFWSFFKGIRKLTEWGITYLQVLAMVPIAGADMTARFNNEKRRFSRNYDRYNGMHVLFKPKRMSKFGVWMSLYFVTIWFYFLTPHGRELSRKRFKAYRKMTKAVLSQGLRWPWQSIKDYISYK